nr:hypothetical protein Iba_chr14fCG12870 [Ipomoea batatas]
MLCASFSSFRKRERKVHLQISNESFCLIFKYLNINFLERMRKIIEVCFMSKSFSTPIIKI